MNNFTDDLLDELDSLGDATMNLEAKAEKAAKDRINASPATQIDATSMALEAAKAAQEAAEESQKATEAVIKLSREQKVQATELAEANIISRQALRAAHNELHDFKSTAGILVGLTTAIAFISTGLMGWLYYSSNQKFETFRGDVLDLLKTENMMFNKHINVKVDQLSSLIELLTNDIQNLVKNSVPNSQAAFAPTRVEVHEPAPLDDAALQEAAQSGHAPMPPAQAPIFQPQQAPQHAPQHNAQPAPAHQPAPAQGYNNQYVQPSQGHAPMQDAHANNYAQPQPMPMDRHNMNAMPMPPAAGISDDQMAHLQNLIESIVIAQQKLQASTLHALNKLSSNTRPITQSNPDGALTEEQVKTLNGISWLVRQQAKAIEKIQTALFMQKGASNNGNNLQNIEQSLVELASQVKALKAQQTEIQQQVSQLQSETQKLSNQQKPYQYRAQ